MVIEFFQSPNFLGAPNFGGIPDLTYIKIFTFLISSLSFQHVELWLFWKIGAQVHALFYIIFVISIFFAK
jgi:hypothetical protein